MQTYQLKDFTGIDPPYEPPEAPELRIDTTHLSPTESAAQVLGLLEARGVIAPPWEDLAVSKRSRIRAFGLAVLLVVAGVAGAIAFSGTVGQVVALVLIGVGFVLATSLLFLEVGLSEDRERARERKTRGTPRTSRQRPRLKRRRGRPRRIR